MKLKNVFSIALLTICSALEGECQETVFMLLKNDLELGDNYFKSKNYAGALNKYLKVAGKKNVPKDINLKIGRCYYFLKEYDLALTTYKKESSLKLPEKDIYYYAEAEAAVGNYAEAILYYKKYLKLNPNNDLVFKKLWRLGNRQYLYEDSSHFEVRPVTLNTGSGELAAVTYADGVVFMSNREEVQMIDQVNASLNAPFYRLYFSKVVQDTASYIKKLNYREPVSFGKSLNSRLHLGPIAFYDQGRKMVITTTEGEAGKDKKRNLQLHFAEKQDSGWEIVNSFPYNSTLYSVRDPAISEDGKLLFFSSDMNGGAGGMDLYKSTLVQNQWTEPENLGDAINTMYDEVFPYLHQKKTLYFSSDGHAGLGGLDIFKSEINQHRYGEVKNMGYPLNTNYDDFALTVDSLHTHGYFSSNRKAGGYNDDIYEFEMDIQTFPLEIAGSIKYKEQSWKDSSALMVLPNAKLELIDNVRNITVYESESDTAGDFSITIPYYSKYKIRVTGDIISEGLVSFEIPKHRKFYGNYEIVVVKDPFKLNENADQKEPDGSYN